VRFRQRDESSILFSRMNIRKRPPIVSILKTSRSEVATKRFSATAAKQQSRQSMNVTETRLPGVLLIEPRVFGDSRGFFLETFSTQRYAEIGIAAPFVQDNWSHSCRGTLRGLHFQIQQPQGKLVHVMQGEIFDVAVDVRQDSPTFGQWFGVKLSAENKRQLWIPPGFAHGFVVLSETADFVYKCTDSYAPQHERTLLWNDESIGVDWPPQGEPILSDKDRNGTTFDKLETFATSPA
jgi:dTDP-4-dehydrorhamnose 3,5-epimerase